jgi:hypothetical protein
MSPDREPAPASEPTPPPASASEESGQAERPEPEWVRRRRLAAVFGDVLPDETSDDAARGGRGGKGDDWYRDQVPPHHG